MVKWQYKHLDLPDVLVLQSFVMLSNQYDHLLVQVYDYHYEKRKIQEPETHFGC